MDIPPDPNRPQGEPSTTPELSIAPATLDEGPGAPARTPRPPWIMWLSVGAAIVLVVGGFFGAKAMAGSSNGSSTATSGAAASGNGNANGNANGNNGQGRGPGTSGTIASISGSTLTVKDTATNSTVNVTTSSSTRVTLAQSVAVGSVVKGDRIFVTGATSGSTVEATTISDLGSSTSNLPAGGGGPAGRTPGEGAGGGANAPPGGRGPGAQGAGAQGAGAQGAGAQGAGGGLTAGTVSSVSSGTIVVSAADGSSTTVKTSASTTVTKSVAGSVSSLKIGDSVRVVGTTSNGSVAATAITEGDSGFGGFGAGNRPPGPTGAGA
jgi:hypothetical protein